MIDIRELAEQASTASIALAELIAPLLRGQGADVQGGALADLVARWLSGMVMAGDAELTDQVREETLETFCATVRRLIPVNESDLVKAIKRTPIDGNTH